MAVDVLHNLVTFALTAIMLEAAARDVPYEEALSELFQQVREFTSEPEAE